MLSLWVRSNELLGGAIDDMTNHQPGLCALMQHTPQPSWLATTLTLTPRRHGTAQLTALATLDRSARTGFELREPKRIGKRDFDGYEVMDSAIRFGYGADAEARHMTRSMTHGAANARHEASLSCIGANRFALDRVDAFTTG